MGVGMPWMFDKIHMLLTLVYDSWNEDTGSTSSHNPVFITNNKINIIHNISTKISKTRLALGICLSLL